MIFESGELIAIELQDCFQFRFIRLPAGAKPECKTRMGSFITRPLLQIRIPKAWAASKKAGSFKVVSA